MTINKPQSDLQSKPIHQLFTKGILDTLKDGETAKLEGDNGSFDFYKKGSNDFGVSFNSMGVKFGNNPMTKEEMENILNPLVSHADNFEGKIPNDLLIRLRNIFFEVNEKNKGKTFTVEDLLKNISLDNVLSVLEFKKELLKETQNKILQGIVEYLENSTNILGEQILRYHKDSVIKNKLLDKLKYLGSYKKTFSDGKFIEGIEKDISDLDNFLDILESQDSEGKLTNEIKDLRNRKNQKYSSAEINTFFNKIYAWDTFAIPYAQFSNSSFTRGLDQGTKDFGELNGWDKGSEEINRLGKKQEPLMDDKLSFEEKVNVFKDANQEYLSSIAFLLGSGRNSLPSDREYYENTKNQIKLEEFISMPCSDSYPAVLQKTILPFYLKDLYQEVCDLLGKKSLDKSIYQYVNELKNPSGFAKLGAAFANNDKKIKSLENIVEKIKLLKTKFNDLDNQIKDFGNKRKDQLVKMASEFCVIEDFVKINNVNNYSPFTMADQDKRLYFMRNN